jgi:hypothetical protein
MLGLTAFALALLAPENTPAPAQPRGEWGWQCTATRDSPAFLFSLTQSMRELGDLHKVRIARVVQRDGPFHELQALQWTDYRGQVPSPAPDALTLPIALTRYDPKSLVLLEHDRGSIALPAWRVLRPGERKIAQVRIEEGAALAALWESAHWRISVIDRKGREVGAVDGALPGREEVVRVFAQLGPEIDARLAAPERQCQELGEAAWL